jgi:hypothetical protein
MMSWKELMGVAPHYNELAIRLHDAIYKLENGQPL